MIDYNTLVCYLDEALDSVSQFHDADEELMRQVEEIMEIPDVAAKDFREHVCIHALRCLRRYKCRWEELPMHVPQLAKYLEQGIPHNLMVRDNSNCVSL